MRVNGQLAVGRLGTRSDADLAWETDLLRHLDRAGMTVPVPIPATDGRFFAEGLVVMTRVEGAQPETAADWRRVADTLRELHRLTRGWPQRPGWRSSTDLLLAETGTRIDLGAMPAEGVARCRAAWARLAGRARCVVHGDPNSGNIRMTADRVALIDWDESHVDVPDLDLVLPLNAAGLDDETQTSPRKHGPHGTPPSAGTPAGPTTSRSGGSPRFERSESAATAQPASPFSRSSSSACSVFPSSSPIPRSTSALFVNWIWSYCTISMRLPSGSRKSRLRPGKGVTPAAASASRTACLSSTTSPKWRASSFPCVRPCISAMNWSPMSTNAPPVHAPAQPHLEELPEERERAVDVLDLERDVVDADQACGHCGSPSSTTIRAMRMTDLEVGTVFGPGDWLTIDQQRIDEFAHATSDEQWIHTDPARAAEGPFGTTVAHGFLTLSLLAPLFDELVAFEDAALTINYGLDRVRFPAPVPVGSRIRATFAVESVQADRGRHPGDVHRARRARGVGEARLRRDEGLPLPRVTRPATN